ncbi:HNH endonuclease [Paraburkholderia bryophila]|uniref:HNH endonuclease n=1 Tax=Paraburkholderia bryophila TaxID=420952 RepID=UPI002349023C|nr:HNH endonuclease signature motif containing protein [Paraburkholderia bryophila]WCM21394.1 HNH endonuclease [Paraburkholderia bryophila]
MSDLRAVPYPADTKAKGWRFELDLERVMQSDTWALATPEIRPWLLMLWTVAWQQVPCGSMPSEDELIAARLGMRVAPFKKARHVLMRGWCMAEDRRLYHETITERVLEKLVRQKFFQRRREYQAQFDAVFARDKEACVYCGKRKHLTLDHVMPKSRGGSDDFENLALACRSCNSSKGARTPEEWLQ